MSLIGNSTDDVDDTDTDEAEAGGPYYFSNIGGAYRDARLHRREDCRVVVRAPGPVQPLNASSVDEYDAEWCPECAPQMGGTYPLPDPDGYDLVDVGREGFHLHLPGDVRLRFDAVREHEAGFLELVHDGEVVGTVAEFDAWPKSVVDRLEEIDPPPDRPRYPQSWA